MNTHEIATFGAGCFWGVEELFRTTPGVISTRVGYMGGKTENPTYKEVCTDTTGHAEVVEVTFDPEKISYKDLLNIFWNNHDPTQHNQQGPDVGRQYRSVIFTHTDKQHVWAQESLEQLEKSEVFSDPIATEVIPHQVFYPAEEYHQQYLHKRGGGKMCHV